MIDAKILPTKIYTKDPDAVLDYTWNWGEVYLEEGETISETTMIVPDGLILESYYILDKKVIAWLSGGTDKKIYSVTCRVTTSVGRTDDWSIKILLSAK